MQLLRRLFNPRTEVARSARGEWATVVPPARSAALESLRWVALDTETSGLDARRDRLLAIGACAIERGRVQLSASFEVLLRQGAMSPVENVLVHGIGHRAQCAGDAPDLALAAFLRFARADAAVGYHTLFDLMLLQRGIRAQLGIRYQPVSLDLALILPALCGRPDACAWELDRWLDHYRIGIFARHQALGDAFATAQLFLIALRRARAQGLHTLAQLLRLQARQLELAQARA